MMFDSLSYVVDNQASGISVVEFPILESLSVDFRIRLFDVAFRILFDSANLQGEHHLAFPRIVVCVREVVVTSPIYRTRSFMERAPPGACNASLAGKRRFHTATLG